jgi:pentapeptide MXKDX repeat protein
MKRNLALFLTLTLLAGTGTAFAQDNRDDHNKPGPTVQGPAMAGPSMAGPGMHVPAMAGPAMKGPAMAGPGMAMHGPAHPDWKQGGHIATYDWGRGVTVDYHKHHLKRPPRGYEWRQVDGNYVLAAAATGLIASIILAIK